MAEWRTIPGYPGYVISDDGVLVSPLGRICKRIDNGNAYHVKNRWGKGTTKRIRLLIEKAKKRGDIVPDPLKRMEEDNASISDKPRRRCHDCGRPTPDYRCAECLKKWRQKHGVSIHADENAFDSIYYGSAHGRGKCHAHQE